MGIFDEGECLDYNLRENPPVGLGVILDEALKKIKLECDAERMLGEIGMYQDGNLKARFVRDNYSM